MFQTCRRAFVPPMSPTTTVDDAVVSASAWRDRRERGADAEARFDETPRSVFTRNAPPAAATPATRRVFEVVVNLLDDEKKRELRAVGQRLKGANGGRAPLPDLVRETVALVGSERWSFAVAEAARRQSRGAPPLPGSAAAPPPLPAAVVSPPTNSSLPVAWQRAGLTERPRDTHSAPRPEEDASSQTLTEAADAGLQTIELRSGGSPVAPPPVLPSVSSDDLGQPERTV